MDRDIIEILTDVLAWITIYVLINLCWIGAEYAFEGMVHTSDVDGVVNGILAYYLLKDIRRMQRSWRNEA